MIYDSGIWKEDLANELKIFKDFLENTDFSFDQEFGENEDGGEERDMSEIASLKFQKFIIYISIIIRKMLESQRLSDKVEQMKFPISVHPKVTTEIVNKRLMWDGIETIYDHVNISSDVISIKRLTDLIIHSFVFIEKFDWHKVDENVPDDEADYVASKILGFYFNSDRSKDQCMFYMSLDVLFNILTTVINDNVGHMIFDKKGNILTKSPIPW